MTLTTITVSGNSTTGILAHGGGVAVPNGLVTIIDSTISDNSTMGNLAFGGGIKAINVMLIGSTVSGNSTAGDVSSGAGVLAASDVNLNHSTVTDNHATHPNSSGGGIWSYLRTTTISDSIVAGNTAAANGDISSTAMLIVTHSLIGDNEGTGLAEAPVGMPDASGNLIGGPGGGVIDAMLGPLADNGGPTQTRSLLVGSPANDAGDIGFVAPPDFDQRGAPFVRVFDGGVNGLRIDMGAYELQAGPSADFDGDGDIDGRDFLAWQRGFGTSPAAKTDGDANNDMDVDGVDLGIWESQFGAPAPLSTISVATIATDSLEFDIPATTARLSANLIDAAIATAWFGIADDQEDMPVEQEPLVESSFALTDVFDSLQRETNITVEARSIISTEHETESSVEQWLSEELLERVFS